MSRIAASGDRSTYSGAYGVRISGLDTAYGGLVEVPERWALLTVHREQAPCPISRPFFVDDEIMELRTANRAGNLCGIRMTRRPLEAWFTSPDGFTDDEILHPDLAVVAAVISQWSGREAFHAGAFITEAGAWAVLGEREAGKSSLMAQLAVAGCGILSDDIVVLDENGRALAGPRCVDLREGAAVHLGLGTDIGMVGERRRWRLRVPDVPPAVPFRGWIVPEWGDRIEFDAVPVATRPSTVFAHRYLQFVSPPDPTRVLALAALPFLTFRRPKRWEVAEEATAALLARLSDL